MKKPFKIQPAWESIGAANYRRKMALKRLKDIVRTVFVAFLHLSGTLAGILGFCIAADSEHTIIAMLLAVSTVLWVVFGPMFFELMLEELK